MFEWWIARLDDGRVIGSSSPGPPGLRLWQAVIERAQEGAGMIAQVVTTTVPTTITDELRKTAEEMESQARKADGCEGILDLSDPTTGEGLSIHLFRDQAAMDA